MRTEQIGDATKWVSIYALCEGDWTPRYVGKTVQYIHERHKAHIAAAKRGGNLPVQRWIAKQIRNGQPLAIKLIERVPPGGDWVSREQYWIRTYRADYKLLNITDGGEGLAGHKFTADHAAKIADALRRGKEHNCDQCGTIFYRKPKDAKSDHLFCSRACYCSWQRGRKKSNASGLMGVAGRAAALAAKAARRG